MFVFTKKSGVTIKWIKYTTKAFDVDRDLVNHTGPTVQFRLEEPAIVALAQAKHVNLPLVIFPQSIINWRTLYGDKQESVAISSIKLFILLNLLEIISDSNTWTS